jgi:hypothetical protein
MMPESNEADGAGVYGQWPRSGEQVYMFRAILPCPDTILGEIDIAESRSNFGDDYPDGRDSVISALHWGPGMMSQTSLVFFVN